MLFLWFKTLLFFYNFEFLFVNIKVQTNKPPNKPCGPGIYMTLYKRSKNLVNQQKVRMWSFKFYMDWYLSNYVASNCFFLFNHFLQNYKCCKIIIASEIAKQRHYFENRNGTASATHCSVLCLANFDRNHSQWAFLVTSPFSINVVELWIVVSI